jgi:hypothetical protein
VIGYCEVVGYEGFYLADLSAVQHLSRSKVYEVLVIRLYLHRVGGSLKIYSLLLKGNDNS